MENYKLTIEDGVITHIEDMDENGNIIPGVLYVPEDVRAFSMEALVFLGGGTEGIVVHEENPVFSSAHNCLLSKDGAVLVKTCKNSRVSALTGLKVIGQDACNEVGSEMEEFIFNIPDGVEELSYRALATNADTVKITVPASVSYIDALAFMIHSGHTHIVFEGDARLEVGVFGTAAEAVDSDIMVYKNMPSIIYPKAENITVTCAPDTQVYAYCEKYGIPVQM